MDGLPDAEHPVEHVRMATLPGMWERTITLGSAGKTFSVTGWKIGWAIAPAPLAHAMLMAHQWIPFTVATPLQEAVAVGLEQADERDYFHLAGAMYQAKRDKLLAALGRCGADADAPDGSYFILLDTSRSGRASPGRRAARCRVCRWLTTRGRRGRHSAQPILQRAAQAFDRQPGPLHLLQDR